MVLSLTALPSGICLTFFPHEIIDRRVDLRLLLGSETEEVGEQIGEANTSAERIAVLEKFLLGKLAHAKHSPGRIDQGVNIIFQQRGMLSVDQLADEVNLSPRQLRRRFKERVGVGAKTYARLKRFNYVKRCLSRNPCLSWKEFIDQGGFYDQSHFIKEFVQFSGEKPTHFIRQRRALREQLINRTHQ